MVSLVQVMLDYLQPKSAITTGNRSHNRCLLQGAFAVGGHAFHVRKR